MAVNNAINSPLLGNIPGALPVASGGTGATSLTAGVLLGNGTGAVTSTAILGVAQGGTGLATLTAHSLYVGNGTSVPTALGVATNGQLVIGSTGADPVLGVLTGAGGITINNSAGAIEIDGSAISAGLVWSTGVTTGALVEDTGSFVTAGSMQTLTLPTGTLSVGDTFAVANAGSFATAWRVAQNAGQAIKIGNTATTTGTGGSLTSSAAGDSVWFVCYDATSNAEKFMVINSQGNITVV